MKKIILIFGYLAVHQLAPAASFDCKKSGTAIEVMICADPELSLLDSRLGANYQGLTRRLSADGVAELRRTQREWLRDRNSCLTQKCLRAKYVFRLDQFEREDLAKPIQSVDQVAFEECVAKERVGDLALARNFWKISNAAIDAFRNRSTTQLAALMHDGTILAGPDKKELLRDGLGAYFTSEQITQLANAEPICNVFNWEGAFIAQGAVWFSYDGEVITSMPGALEPQFNYGQKKLIRLHQGEYIDPACIEVPWTSGDNFEDYSEKYRNRGGLGELIENPLGQADKNYEGGLLKTLALCEIREQSVDQDRLEELIVRKMVNRDGSDATADDDWYQILGIQPNDVCQPFVGGGYRVTSCFVTETGQGQVRGNHVISLHALIDNRFVAPVKFFRSRSGVREFLTSLPLPSSKSLLLPCVDDRVWDNCFGKKTYLEGRYEGEYRDSNRNGWGVFYLGNGDRYEGEWRGDLPHGAGTYYRANGEVTEATWVDGKLAAKSEGRDIKAVEVTRGNFRPSEGYGDRLQSLVRSKIVLIKEVPGNPSAEVVVLTSEDGTIIGRTLSRSSGSPAWDEAVLKAIDKTQIFPRDGNGMVPSKLIFTFRAKQ